MKSLLLLLALGFALGCATVSEVGNNLLGAKVDVSVGKSEEGHFEGGISIAHQGISGGIKVTPKDGELGLSLDLDVGGCSLLELIGMSPSFCGQPEE